MSGRLVASRPAVLIRGFPGVSYAAAGLGAFTGDLVELLLNTEYWSTAILGCVAQ